MKPEKPEWLKALEAQSWQAELIASGLAIYGSISMGPYLNEIVEWCALRFNDRNLTIFYYMFIYVYAAHAILMVSFIAHLGLRILWAGILGLSSVYPNGINTDSEVYASHYMEKLKKEFPDLSEYSLKLDKQCSMIFSVLCAFVIILFSCSFWILVYVGISELLLNIMPVAAVNSIGYAIVILLGIFFVVNALLSNGKLKNSDFAKKYAYKINQKTSKGLYFIGYSAINYIMQTIRTNVTSKLFFIGMIGILFFSMLISIPNFSKMIPYYQSDLFVRLNMHANQVVPENYLENMEGKTLLRPVVQSEVITDNYVKLFIPRFKRELTVVQELCGTYEWNDDLPRQENYDKRDAFRTECASKYYTLYLDDVPVDNVSFDYKRYLHNNKSGYQVFLNIDSLTQGKHELRIEAKYKSDRGHQLRRVIPFYKANN